MGSDKHEINRGNVSAIFGELITLLEDDKRIGNKEEIELMLPYSKTKFGVPNNVYIIGTMNTADRSVEALDTALRRRFLFTEVAPMPQLIQSEGSIEGELMVADKSYDLTEILGLINKRIEVLLDKDHMIGHSFFLKVNSVDDLKMTFGKNIIPLLQEYFFGDYGKISLVLGEGFCKGLLAKEGFSGAVFSKVSSGYESEMFLDKLIYTIYDPILDLSDDNKFAEALDKLLNR